MIIVITTDADGAKELLRRQFPHAVNGQPGIWTLPDEDYSTFCDALARRRTIQRMEWQAALAELREVATAEPPQN